MPKREPVIPESGKVQYDQFHFAQASRVGETVYASGQIGMNEDGSISDDPETQFRSAWTHVQGVLDEAGLTMADIGEFTSYHVGLRDSLGKFMKVKDEFLGEPYPAWTAIGVSELAIPGALVEIRVIATDP